MHSKVIFNTFPFVKSLQILVGDSLCMVQSGNATDFCPFYGICSQITEKFNIGSSNFEGWQLGFELRPIMSSDAVNQPQSSTLFPLPDVMQSMSGNKSYPCHTKIVQFGDCHPDYHQAG